MKEITILTIKSSYLNKIDKCINSPLDDYEDIFDKVNQIQYLLTKCKLEIASYKLKVKKEIIINANILSI